MKRFLLVWGLVFVVGCSSPRHLTINKSALSQNSPIYLRVAKVRLIMCSPSSSEYKHHWFNDIEANVGEPFQSDLNKELSEYFTNLVIAQGDGNDVAVVNITRSCMTATVNGLNEIPFLGIIPFIIGQKETFTTYIAGAIEIEDSYGHVLKKADFSVDAASKEVPYGEKECFRGINTSATMAIDKLDEEIRQVANRYLYDYLIASKTE